MLKVKEMFCLKKKWILRVRKNMSKMKNKGDLDLKSCTVSVFVVSVVYGLWWACKFPNKTCFDLEIPPF